MITQVNSEDDFKQFQDLSSYAFNFEIERDEQAISYKRWQKSLNLKETIEGHHASQMVVYPFEVNLAGAMMPMAGVSAVATYPEYRGNGGINRLFTHLFQQLAQEGITLSYLAPFSQRFYRKFGYELIFNQQKASLPSSEMAQFKDLPGGKLIRIKSTDENQQALIKDLYAETLAHYSGSLQRADWWWESLFSNKDNHYVVCLDDQHHPCGYLIYQMDQTTSTFTVTEIGAKNKFALNKLAAYVASHLGSFKTFTFIGAVSQQLDLLIEETTLMTKNIIPSMMVKIVLWEKFIEKYSFTPGKELHLLIGVVDDTCPWNHGTWQLGINESGAAAVTRVSAEITTEANFSGTMQTWTQILFGHSTIKEHLLMDRLQSNQQIETADFTNRLPEIKLGLFDYF